MRAACLTYLALPSYGKHGKAILKCRSELLKAAKKSATEICVLRSTRSWALQPVPKILKSNCNVVYKSSCTCPFLLHTAHSQRA